MRLSNLRCRVPSSMRGMRTAAAQAPESATQDAAKAASEQLTKRQDPSLHPEFLELNLHGLTKVRAEPLKWAEAFADAQRPLIVDLGCGYGRFLLLLAHRNAQRPESRRSHLGLEIREPIIDRANEWARRLDMDGDTQFALVNATISFESMLSSYPGPVELVTIQYPDPHFKKRHRKRHLVQAPLCLEIAAKLEPGAQVFLQSDVLGVAEYMRDTFESAAGQHFQPDASLHQPDSVFFQETPPPEPAADAQPMPPVSAAQSEPAVDGSSGEAGAAATKVEPPGVAKRLEWSKNGWLTDNPLGVPTERELHTTDRGLPVYRIMLVKR